MKRFNLWDIITVVFGLVILWQVIQGLNINMSPLSFLGSVFDSFEFSSIRTILFLGGMVVLGGFLILQVRKSGSYGWIGLLALFLLILSALGPERAARLGTTGDQVIEKAVAGIENITNDNSSINVLCQDENGGALPRCEIVTLTSVPIDMFAPSGHCLSDNPGGTMQFAQSPKGTGWWSLTSKSGQPVQVGIFKPRTGDVFFGSPCI